MTEKKLTRGINKEFAKAFKECILYNLYKENSNELIIGVRNNYLNLYYNCDSIAKVEYKQKKITCEIDKYYLEGTHYFGKNKRIKIAPSIIYLNYKKIKVISDGKATLEKKAQSKLVILNNNNDSRWYCFDLEWVKAFKNLQAKKDSNFNGRFDIIAISKEAPHRVALIELKYGSRAIGGSSGIYKHIEDFVKYQENKYFDKQEIFDIIESHKLLDLDLPTELKNIKLKDIVNFEFYIITLDNNVKKMGRSNPKQTMAGYLFNDNRWNNKKVSTRTVQASYKDVTDKNNSLHVNFLFSNQTFPNITINDIIEYIDYERE
jgi:hypothetical protein